MLFGGVAHVSERDQPVRYQAARSKTAKQVLFLLEAGPRAEQPASTYASTHLRPTCLPLPATCLPASRLPAYAPTAYPLWCLPHLSSNHAPSPPTRSPPL